MAEINIETVAYVLGILSIVFAFFSPLAGLIMGIVGLIQSKKKKVARARKLNIIGIVLSAIFFILTIALLIMSGGSSTSGSFPLF